MFMNCYPLYIGEVEEAKMATAVLRHKHVQLDQGKLDRARRVLGARTETATLDRALDLVVTEADIDRALRAAAGKTISDACSECSASSSTRTSTSTGCKVVVLERYAGAFSERDRRVLRGIVAAFGRADRLLVPSASVWEEAGHVLRALQASRGSVGAGYPSLVDDVLIALSASAIGAIVTTINERDFVAIRRDRPFKLAVVPG